MAAAKTAPSVLRLSMPDASPTVDPALVADEQSVEVAELLYSGLVRLDSFYNVVPDAAASWTLGRDRRTYTFHLRKGLRFSNGDPVTAYDFQYSITRSLSHDLRSPSAPIYLLDIDGAGALLSGKSHTLKGIHALNALTLRITARWPVPYFLMELTYPTSFALDARVARKANGVNRANPIGSGPYRLKDWSPNSSMVFVRNKYFHGPTPSIASINISFTPLPTSGMYASVTHSLDVATLCSTGKGLRGQAGVRDISMLAINGLYMNFSKKPFNKLGVRRALMLGLHRSALVQSSFGKHSTPFAGYVPVGESGYDSHLHIPGYNVREAQRQLRLAGFPGGKKFPATTLYYADDPCNPGVARLIQQIVHAWHKNLKIPVDSQPLTLNTLLANVQAGKLGLYMSGWSADYPDAHDWLSLQWASDALNNNVRFNDARFDQLARTADVTWQGQRRMALYHDAQQELVDRVAWIPLYIPHRLVYLRPAVLNLAVTGYGLIPRGGNWAQVQVRVATRRVSRRAIFG